MTRSTLAESVADVLRHAIFQGVYLSGERLVEMTIAQEMNVSQNTTRDALRLLEHDGLVVKRPRYGTYIRSFTPDEALELFALWAAVESLALEWTLDRITEEQQAALAELVNRMHTSILLDRAREALEVRFQFHDSLVEIADRPRTTAILRRIHNQIRLLENLRQASMTPPQKTVQEVLVGHYQVLVEAIRRRDQAQAQACLCACIDADRAAVIAVVSS